MITRLVCRVDTFEIKEELAHADRFGIQRLIKSFETLDTEFCQHHYAIAELLDDEAVDEEQVALDDHNERVTNLVNRLQFVLEPKEAVFPPCSADPSRLLQKQLERIEKRIQMVNEMMKSLHPRPAVNQCLLRQLD